MHLDIMLGLHMQLIKLLLRSDDTYIFWRYSTTHLIQLKQKDIKMIYYEFETLTESIAFPYFDNFNN